MVHFMNILLNEYNCQVEREIRNDNSQINVFNKHTRDEIYRITNVLSGGTTRIE